MEKSVDSWILVDYASKCRSVSSPSNNSSREIKVGKDTGRVKVFVRIKPFTNEKNIKYESLPYEISEEKLQVRILSDERGHTEKTYQFDHVFGPDRCNDHVCSIMTPPLVEAAMNGFNGTLMAYGQTGSGKTYSLMSANGITQNMIDQCFRRIHDDGKHDYKVTMSYLQIYQEKLYDLLTNSNDKTDLTIRENPKTGVYVENLTEYVVRSPHEVIQFLEVGKKKLVFGETRMNRTSSRSHSVFQMTIERTLQDGKDVQTITRKRNSNHTQINKDPNSLDLNSFGKDVIIRGKIHICDLAGSERIKKTGATGDRLSEAQHINSSLLELGNVIQALADEKTMHIPFRNSVLTRLLQESLGGNCKTSLIICTSPSNRDLHETKCTLNFGSRAMKVKNTAYVNMEVDFKKLSDELMKQLQRKEDELFQVRQKYQDDIDRECDKVRNVLEKANKEKLLSFELEREVMEEKMICMNAELCELKNELNNRRNRIKGLEDSILSMDDILKHERDTGYQMLKTENHIKSFMSSSNMIENIVALTVILEHCILETESNYTEELLLENFLYIQQSVVELEKYKTKNMDTTEELLEKLKKRLEKLSNQVAEKNNNSNQYDDSDIVWLRYNLFLGNVINNLLQSLKVFIMNKKKNDMKAVMERKTEKTLDLDDDVSDRSDNRQETVKAKYQTYGETWNNAEDTIVKLPILLEKKQLDNGTQYDISDFSPNRRLVDTTVEEIEKIITEIQSENITDRRDIKRSGEIFSGFSTTLGRIENMVSKERRYTNRIVSTNLVSRFDVSSILDDSYRYGIANGPVSVFDKYDPNDLAYDTQDYTAKYKNNAIHKRDDYKDKKLDSRFIDKFKELNDACQKLKQENAGFLALIEQLTILLPDKTLIDEIRRVIKVKRNTSETSTQTNDSLETNGKDKGKNNNVKVAHIKPRVMEDSPRESNSKRIQKDLFGETDDPLTNQRDIYDDYQFKKSLKLKGSVSELNFASDSKQIGLSESIISANKNIELNRNTKSSFLEKIRESEDTKLSDEEHILLRTIRSEDKKQPQSRPQTWYGKSDDHQNRFSSSLSNSYEKLSNDYHAQEQLLADTITNDVRFAKSRRSAWSLPVWIKTRKHLTSSSNEQFVQ